MLFFLYKDNLSSREFRHVYLYEANVRNRGPGDHGFELGGGEHETIYFSEKS